MRTVAVTSIKGGAGTTTIVAHLGHALKKKGVPVVLIDLCPTNQLCLHLGMEWAERERGLKIIYKNMDDIMYRPYGDGIAFEENIEWHKHLFPDIDLPENGVLIVDCPSLNEVTNSAVAKIADKTLLVMTADPACYASLHSYTSSLKNSTCIVNRFDPMMALEADIFDIVVADYPELLLPFTIHRDESVREALAHKQTVFSYAANSQAAHDYLSLADWLINQETCETSHE